MEHQDVLKHFHEVTKEFDHSKLYQISMDGPGVNLKLYKELVPDRQENMVHSLVDISSCSLHIVHGTFKTGAEKTGRSLKALPQGSFQILHDIPASIRYSSVLYSEFFCFCVIFLFNKS